MTMANRQPRSIPQTDGPSAQASAGMDSFALPSPETDAYLALPEVIQHSPHVAKDNQSWRWLLISLLSCCATSVAAVGAFLWLINLPPTTNCDNATTITTDRAQLYCAQLAAESGELEDVLGSLSLVGAWTTSHPLYYEVQPLVEQWSWVALKAAEQELRNGQIEEAKSLIGRIPASSPVYEAGQASLAEWNAEWDQGAALLAKAETALQQKDWGTASTQVLALAELQNPHWRIEQVQALSRQVRQERQAQALLKQAVAIASPGGVERLGEAIRTASQIDEDTFTHQAAQVYLDRWSDLLLKQGLDFWYASKLEQAQTLGRYVALNPNRAKAAQELIWLSQSRQMAQQSLGTWRTSPDQLVVLYKAMLLANRIPADSPYYPQAKSSVATWRTHLGALGKLQTAQLAGQINHLDTLKLAIHQAETVPLGHPRRIQAQTMMAHWQLEVERLEDRPYLANAHELASDQTIQGLQAAIESASAIATNRALRSEAQSWIYIWTNQIQTLEDRPILNRARYLAEGGQLTQAIREARTIESGRALYDEAQAAIADWQGQIWAQEQARQREAQRALANRRQLEAESKTSPESATGESAETEAGEVLVPTGSALPSAPAPVILGPQERRLPLLPTRLETVPGDAPLVSPNSDDPVTQPQPSLVPNSDSDLPTPPDPTLADPSPLVPTSPALAPMPTSESSPPIAPTTAPSHLSPTGAYQPEAESQSQVPDLTPSVSAQPQPEQVVAPQVSSEPDVIYTGALYTGL